MVILDESSWSGCSDLADCVDFELRYYFSSCLLEIITDYIHCYLLLWRHPFACDSSKLRVSKLTQLSNFSGPCFWVFQLWIIHFTKNMYLPKQIWMVRKFFRGVGPIQIFLTQIVPPRDGPHIVLCSILTCTQCAGDQACTYGLYPEWWSNPLSRYIQFG